MKNSRDYQTEAESSQARCSLGPIPCEKW